MKCNVQIVISFKKLKQSLKYQKLQSLSHVFCHLRRILYMHHLQMTNIMGCHLLHLYCSAPFDLGASSIQLRVFD